MINSYILDKSELNDTRILEIIEAHRRDGAKIQRCFDYYLGNVSVNKGVTARGRPDNRANTNLAKYIVDTATGYFAGAAPKYKYSNITAERVLGRIFDENDEAGVNFEIAQNMAIAGAGYDLVYISEDKKIKICALDPRKAFVIYSGSIDREPIAAVRYFTRDARLMGEIYEAGRTRQFEMSGGKLKITGSVETPFEAPNVTEYVNGRFRMGDFEAAMENIDLYNLALSGAADDMQSIANAYLVLNGFEQPDEETMEVLRTERVIAVPSDGGASYITKNIHDAAMQNHKATLKADILQVCGVPDLTDECFSGISSGVAIRYKLWGIDQLFSRKAAGMEKGLFNRMRLIRSAAKALYNEDIGEPAHNVSVEYIKNMPQELSNQVDIVNKLRGIVSDKTLREMLESVTGVSAAEEEERMEEGDEIKASKEPN